MKAPAYNYSRLNFARWRREVEEAGMIAYCFRNHQKYEKSTQSIWFFVFFLFHLLKLLMEAARQPKHGRWHISKIIILEIIFLSSKYILTNGDSKIFLSRAKTVLWADWDGLCRVLCKIAASSATIRGRAGPADKVINILETDTDWAAWAARARVSWAVSYYELQIYCGLAPDPELPSPGIRE